MDEWGMDEWGMDEWGMDNRGMDKWPGSARSGHHAASGQAYGSAGPPGGGLASGSVLAPG